jgi:endoglucanase
MKKSSIDLRLSTLLVCLIAGSTLISACGGGGAPGNPVTSSASAASPSQSGQSPSQPGQSAPTSGTPASGTPTSGTPGDATPPAGNSLSVQVSGNHLVNQNGQTIHLIGFNAQGSEYMCVTTNQTFDNPNTLTTAPADMKTWGAAVNIARIPMNEDCWLGINGVSRGGAAYQNDIVAFVNKLHASGMYAILDLHWNAPGTTQATGELVMADYDHSIAFWQSVATTFKNDSGVIFELYNEPQSLSWPCWDTGGSTCVYSGFRTAGMEEMLQAIRNVEGTGWAHPILAGGQHWSNDLTGWLANRPADPANQLIAAIHTYDDSNICPTSPGGPWNASSCADTVWGGIKTAGYPIVFTEVGDTSAGGCTYSTFLDSAYKWMDANSDGYLPWAWGPFGCSNPSLTTDWTGTPVSTYGTGTKAHIQSLPTTY